MKLNMGNKIKILDYEDEKYPGLLRMIQKPPKTLYYEGNLGLLAKPCVSVVGSRTTTTYGRNTAKNISTRLAERGICVVSGMARGIDSCAHEAALAVGGSTIAVMGCGIDICYPPENEKLKKAIEKNGLLISEYPMGTPANKWNFPQRNRIISGLSQLTIVVQARNRSGSLITAELAAEQGREVMAVPGNIDSQYNLGTNKLIKEGAIPIISVDDVLEPLGLKQIDSKIAKEKLSETEYAIYKLLEEQGEMTIDEICLAMKSTAAYINPILAVMEMKGFTFSDLGKIFLANA